MRVQSRGYGFLRRASGAVLAGLAVAFLVLFGTGDGLLTLTGGRLGGDFPAFYGAGQIVAAGDTKHLYHPPTQQAVQAPFFPEIGSWLPFAYPPFVATAYVPLAALPFRQAFALHTVSMVLYCALAVLLLRQAGHIRRADTIIWLALTLTFYPVLRGVLGGQNTAVSILCASAISWALHFDRAFLAGMWLAAWMFKPQIGLCVVSVLVVGGHARILRGFIPGVLALYGLGAWTAGLSWPVWWCRDVAAAFTVADLAVDRSTAVSLSQFALSSGRPWFAVAIAATVSSWVLYRASRRPRPIDLVAAASCAALLISPHALYYDVGVAVIGLAALNNGVRSHPRFVAAAWSLSWLQIASGSLPFAPSAIVLTSVLVAVLANASSTLRPGPNAQRDGL